MEDPIKINMGGSEGQDKLSEKYRQQEIADRKKELNEVMRIIGDFLAHPPFEGFETIHRMTLGDLRVNPNITDEKVRWAVGVLFDYGFITDTNVFELPNKIRSYITGLK